MQEMRQCVRALDADGLFACAEKFDEIDTIQAKAWAANARGIASNTNGDKKKAIEYYATALGYFEKLDDAENDSASLLSNMSTVYYGLGDTAKALEFSNRGLEGHLRRGSKENAANVLMNMSVMYRASGDIERTIEYIERALDIYHELNLVYQLERSYSNLGIAVKATGDYAKALEIFYKQLELNRVIQSPRRLIVSYLNIGSLFIDAGSPEYGRDFLEKASAIADDVTYPVEYAGYCLHMSHSHVIQQEYEKAIPLLRKGLDLMIQCELRESTGEAYIVLMKALYFNGQKDEVRPLVEVCRDFVSEFPFLRTQCTLMDVMLIRDTGDHERARSMVQEALKEIESSVHKSTIAECHFLLRDIARALGDFDAYVAHNDAYAKLTEELKGTEASRRIAMQQKDQEIQAERKEHEKHLAVLHSTLPKHIADRVANGETVTDYYDSAAVLFLDIVGFTVLSNNLTGQQVTTLLDKLFVICDDACNLHRVTRVKTIGDSYFAFCELVNAK